MPGTRKSVFGGEAPKKTISRQSSFQLKADPIFLSKEGSKPSQQKKNARRPSAKALSTQPEKKDTNTRKKEKPVYDMAATKKFDSMLRGDLTNLPPLPKSMVKIFLSSTFSDMRAERNTLAREVYPSLQTFCASRDLDFQVVDMRWGVTEDSINDHSVENLCLLEIENCQKRSIGPNFVVLSGDRYGFRPIPVNIDVETFEVIQYEASKLNLPSRELLDVWYRLDTNSVPPLYTLQPIRSKFTFFGDFSPGCDELRERDTTEWWETFEKLQIVLRTASDEAHKQKKFTSERKHHFFQSVTESEIQDGILKAEDVDLHCLVYKRRLRHLCGVGINDRDTPRYIDVIKTEKGNKLDEEVEKLKVLLFEDRISKKLDPTNIKDYSIHWMPGGVNPDKTDEHKEYLSSFCKDFLTDCKRLIQKAEEKTKTKLIKLSDYYTDYNSTIHHLSFCVSKCESFCGQEQVLASAKSYILDKTGRKPLVLYAPSGVGKTSVMAMIMKSIPKWLNNAPHLRLIRFLGTSPQCSNIYDLLVDVLGHLSDVYDLVMSPPNYKTMKRIVQFTPRYLRQVANIAKEPIVILLDSLDQLYSRNNAYSMDWLPIFLPQNVKLIVSTLPNQHNILSNLKKRLPDQDCYIEVPALTEETAKQIIETNLQVNNRSLSASQMSFFWSKFQQAQSPLFLKLLLDEARKWKSYTPITEMELMSNVKGAINGLFNNLEKKFGTLLVSRALGFVTVGLSGLTEFEIDDALSCDDDVLNEVYRFHDPPVPGIVQIPPLLWARIWYDIHRYLVERMSYGKTTLNWYHREFVLAAVDMYTKGDNGVLLNKTLFEIYSQESGIKRTIILQNRNQLEVIDADREVTPQPYKADNKRKLACLPYHAIRAYQAIGIDRVKAEVYCNFKYLYAKITAFSVAAVVNDLSDFVERSKDKEVQLLLNFITNCTQDLTNQIRFAFCLLAYVNPENKQYQLKKLLNDTAVFLESKKKQVLIPEFPCLAQRANALDAFQISIKGVSDILMTSSSNALLKKHIEIFDAESEECQVQSDIAVWRTETQELINVVIGDDTNPISQYILGDEYMYYITKDALVRIRFSDSNSEKVLFKNIIAEWKISSCVHNLFANSEATTGVLVKDHSIILINLERMERIQEFNIPNKNLTIENIFVLSSVQKLIVVGRKHTMPAENHQPKSECLSLILVFEQGKDTPIQTLDFEKPLDCKTAVLSCRDQWLVIAAERGLVSKVSESQIGHDLPDSSVQLLAFDVGENCFTQNDIKLSSAVSKIYVHPERINVIILTSNGQVYMLHEENFSEGSADREIHLNFPVKVFTVSWEDDIGLFCSSGGRLAVYDLKLDNILLVFAAHSDEIKDICLLDQQLITLGEDREMKSWAVKTLLQDRNTATNDPDLTEVNETLLEQTNVVGISPSYNGMELITCHDSGIIKVWSVNSKMLLRQYSIGLTAHLIHTFANSSVAFLDTSVGRMRILDTDNGKETFQLPDAIKFILHSTTDKKDNLYIVSSPRKGKEQIDIVSINREMVLKTIHLQNGLSYKSLDTVLSANDRYLVIRLLMSEKDFDHVRELYHTTFPWKKGGFSEQHHRYRFTAVALMEGSGALIHCNRIAEKVPTIGILMQPYRGNIMLISTRKWIVFWDIPTGRCDRKPSKLQKVSMFFRPAWIREEYCGATRVIIQSQDQKFLAGGSDDGYVFVFNSETGLPVCNRKPLSKHNAKVSNVVVSPDSKLVASSCQNSILKMWECSTGLERFSVRLDAEVMGMSFLPDSRRLLLYTGTNRTRVFLFSVASGKTDYALD